MHKTKPNYGLKSKQEVLKKSKQRNNKKEMPKRGPMGEFKTPK